MIINDTDILRTEAELFSAGCFTSQVLCGGDNGIVAGTQFTAAGVDFTASQISAGQVIRLESADGVIRGGYEIVQILDSGHLTASILRTDSAAAAIPIGSASGLTWNIKTFGPQILTVETELSYRLRCLPGWTEATVTLAELPNAEAVKLIALYRLLADLYGVLDGTYPIYTADSAAAAWKAHRNKHLHYQRLAEMMISLL